ncbi:hypothetical protein LVJ94_27555 [Pendulispora rubella]|uniref:Choice-of-anchor D domain-containing protein n=1 Tax=Pendulispora rubella TaxID=2741070 RepID=A0ABZ2KPT1_9BACT
MKRWTKAVFATSLGFLATAPACTSRARVDLSIDAASPFLAPGETGAMTLRVGNRGRDPAHGAEVTVVTPFFVNFARPVPPDCQLRYENPDPFLPEVLICQLNGTIAPGEEQSLAVPVTLAPGGPPGRNSGTVLVLPAAGSRDTETALSDNQTQASVLRLRQAGEAPPVGNPVGIYLAGDELPISVGSHSVTTLTVGNAGPNATSVPVRVIYRTPFFTNIDADTPLPAGCKMQLTDTAPNVPEIVECAVPADLKAGEEQRIRIPLALVADGPTGRQLGWGLAASSAPADADPFAGDNVHSIGVLMLTGPSASSLGPDTKGASLAGPPVRWTAEAPPVPSNGVDLAVSSDNVTVTPGSTASASFRVINRGNVATRAPARLAVVTPFYANAEREGLPPDCKVVVSNPQPNIPEVVECSIPAGVAPGQTVSLDLPLEVLPGGPVGLGAGAMFVAAGQGDVELSMLDNASRFSVQRSASPIEPLKDGVDLWVSNDQPVIGLNQPRSVTLRYGNIGRLPTHASSELVYVTPFYVNVDRSAPLPGGCRVQAEHRDPLIPETVVCAIPAGLIPGEERQLTLPLSQVPGGPAGSLAGKVSFVPGAGDTEVYGHDNMHDVNVIVVGN